MGTLVRCLTASVLMTAVTRRGDAQAASELSAEQRMAIDAGRQVVLTWEVRGSPWPRACVYQYIDATPEEAAAVFTNYERHRAYIPDIRKAAISRVVDAVTAEVDYTLRVPIVADEDYTVRDHLSTYHNGASYRIEWTLVRASSTKATEGSVRFEPHHVEKPQRDGTLMAHCNLVTPGSRLAKLSFIRSKALRQARETARAIAAEVERERAGDLALLDGEVQRIRTALRPAAGQPHPAGVMTSPPGT